MTFPVTPRDGPLRAPPSRRRAALIPEHRTSARPCRDADEFAASRENPGPGQEHIDLRRLPPGLRLEIQYVLQCRGDEQDTRLPPEDVRPFAAVLAAAGASSLLDRPEEWWTARPSRGSGHGWRAFVLDARRRVEALASGAGWETEYPRDTWRLRVLGTARGDAAIRFTGIPQPWLKDLAKRYARWQLSTGLTAATARAGALGMTRFAAWLASLPEPPAGLDGVDRPLLERYLAVLHAEMGGQQRHQQYVSALSGFLREIRRHGWDGTMPATAVIFPEDFPARGARLPRGLADHVMAQVEQPASLDRWDSPAYRLITVILIRCGLRISSAAGIAFDCTVTGPDGAPYLRYYNTKMKREALVPIDGELHQMIAEQKQRVLQRFPAGTPVLFPRPTGNLKGRRPIAAQTYRKALYRWLADCDVRDEHAQPVHLTPHQWRHTLGTVLKGRGVASDATFGSSREHAVPAAQRAALRCARPAGTPRGCGDLGLQGPPVSDAAMMQLIPLRGLHHHCACWHPDAPGSSRLHRVHHRLTQRAAPSRHRSCEGHAGPPHHWPRHASHLATSRSRCTSCIPAPDDGCSRCRQLARHPRGTLPGRRAADAAATHRSRTGRRSWPGPATRLERSVPITTNLGSSLQAPRSG